MPNAFVHVQLKEAEAVELEVLEVVETSLTSLRLVDLTWLTRSDQHVLV